jgi:hypothetical protein
MVCNLVLTGAIYGVLSRRVSSPVAYFLILAAVSTIGAAVLTDNMGSSENKYPFVVALPLCVTALVTVKYALMSQSKRTSADGESPEE